MFLVKDQEMNKLVFTWEDPRKDGYGGEVEEGSLDYDMEKVHSWPDGSPRPDPCVGISPDDPKKYRVFKFAEECRKAGYWPVPGTPLVFGRWAEYVQLRDFLVGPDYLHFEFDAGPEDELSVTLLGQAFVPEEGRANVLLLDNENFEKYQRRKPFQYEDGGFAKKSVVHLYPPHNGHWHVVIDLGGYRGRVRAKVEQRKLFEQQVSA